MLRTVRQHVIRAVAVTSIGITMSPSLAVADDGSYLGCLPERLHPVSARILAAFLDGRLTESDFRWGFHLPNSDYLSVGECILTALHRENVQSCNPEDPPEGGSDSCLSF